jgi:nucleotide-binding universal stress UspA family protein
VLPKLEGLDFRVYALGGGSAAHRLYEVAEEEDVDLIVVGSTSRGPLGRVLPGSVGERLLHGAACPVAIASLGLARSRWRLSRPVGVAYDGSPEAGLALEHAAALARTAGVPLRVVGVSVPFSATPFDPRGPRELEDALEYERSIDEHRREATEASLRAALDRVPGDLEASPVLREGEAAEELVRASEELGVLVLGSRGYGPLRHLLLGRVSRTVTRAARCPTLLVPRGAVAEAGAAEGRELATAAEGE